MRRKLPTFFFSLLFINLVYSQDRFAYAITDVNPATGNWTVLRRIDFQTGMYTDALLNGVNPKFVAYDAVSKKQVDGSVPENSAQPFSTGVAAIAYDRANNRIYYTPMFIDQLRYIDLRTMKVYYLTGQSLSGEPNPTNDNAKVVSRMVIAPDGYGYAITNDATSFVRFNTASKKLIVEQLGTLVDDPANTGISVHNGCSSWGGDIVADDANNLYLFSASNNVFKINTQTKVSTWLGPLKGLPAGFTTNGAVVTDDGNLLVGSQAFSKNWFVVDPRSWQAGEFKTPNGVYLTSDLANSNYLSTHVKTTDVATIPQIDAALSNAVQLYPNPLSLDNNQFKIQFNKLKGGDYTIELTDVTGKQIMMQKISVVTEGQIQTINLKPNTAQGIYLVKITDINSKSVFTQKLVVQ